MFKEEDFKLPMEKEFTLSKISKEIDDCNDIDVIKNHLKDTARQLMRYQHLLTVTLTRQLEEEISKLIPDSK